MRTKLIVGAAIMAASLFTSLAQNVYSLNVVGYYNVTVPGGGFSFAANQLKAGNNTITEVIPPSAALANAGVVVLAFDRPTGKFQENVTDGTAWFDNVTGDPTGTSTILAPGGSFLFNNPGATFTQTFVGEVMQGTLTVNIAPGGLNAISSMVPQQFNIADNAGTGFPQSTDLVLYFLNAATGKYQFYVTDGSGQWFDNVTGDPVTVTPAVGVGFFAENVGASTIPWTRNFTVQ